MSCAAILVQVDAFLDSFRYPTTNEGLILVRSFRHCRRLTFASVYQERGSNNWLIRLFGFRRVLDATRAAMLALRCRLPLFRVHGCADISFAHSAGVNGCSLGSSTLRLSSFLLLFMARTTATLNLQNQPNNAFLPRAFVWLRVWSVPVVFQVLCVWSHLSIA